MKDSNTMESQTMQQDLQTKKQNVSSDWLTPEEVEELDRDFQEFMQHNKGAFREIISQLH